MEIARKIFRPIVDFVLPLRCAGCGDIVAGEGGFCTRCWADMDFIGPPWCCACGLPLPFEGDATLDGGGGQHCGACLAKEPAHDGIRAAVAYCDISRQIALKLKYGGKIGLAKLIAGQLKRHLPAQSDDILLVPVPLHWTRLWARSFNQSALIADALYDLSGIQNIPDMLIRTKRTQLLRGKSGKERQREVSNAFAIHPKWQDNVAGRHILLVDDIYTSGATSGACVNLLKAAGAQKVEIYCWARVLRDENLPDGGFEPVGGFDMA